MSPEILLEFNDKVVFYSLGKADLASKPLLGQYFKPLISFLFFVRNSVEKRKFLALKYALGDCGFDRLRSPKFNVKWRIPKKLGIIIGMIEILFNPFEDRTDRDVRNLLGSAFICALHKGDQAPVAQAVSDLGRKKLPAPAQSYIKARCDRYAAVLAQMSSNSLLGADIYATAGLLWDESLFFECHEWLEQNYRAVQGQEKKVLQAMIRTAGTFELLTYNRDKAAVSVAAKALAVLEPHFSQVPESFNIQPKIARLKNVVKTGC